MLTFIPLLSAAFLLVISSPCHATILQDTCRSIAASHPGIGYEFCVASLQADPACSSAVDRRGLAMIATRLSLARASTAVSAIANLTRVESDPSRRGCLGVCSEVYDEAIDHLHVALRDLGFRKYREAVTFLSAAVDAPVNCEDAFKEVVGDEGASPSPLGDRDRDYARVADVALAIAAHLG